MPTEMDGFQNNFKNEIPPPAYDDTLRPGRISDASSDISTTASLLDADQFQPTSTLRVEARGSGAWDCVSSSVEHNILILHEDGSTAYTSTRTAKYRSNTVLVHPTQGELVTTKYSFGLTRNPKVEMLQDPSKNLTVSGKMASRNVRLATSNGQTYEWSYAKIKDANGKRVKIMALRDMSSSNLLAQLVRGEGTRTEHTSRWSSGNGGLLVIGEQAEGRLDEPLIVATCLMMLKYEIDRNRSSVVAPVVVVT